MVSDTFHFALICTFIAIKIVSPLRGLKLDNAVVLSSSDHKDNAGREQSS